VCCENKSPSTYNVSASGYQLTQETGYPFLEQIYIVEEKPQSLPKPLQMFLCHQDPLGYLVCGTHRAKIKLGKQSRTKHDSRSNAAYTSNTMTIPGTFNGFM